jgi:hypothetical protein
MTAQGREPTVLPPGLRDRVLDASRQARAVGCPVPEVHGNDILLTAGLPSSAPDASTLRLTTELACRALPPAATRTGRGPRRGLRARLD